MVSDFPELSLPLWTDFAVFIIEQKVLRTLLSSFLHNCQHSLRTDSHFYLLCNLEPSHVSHIFPGSEPIVHRTPGPMKKEVSLFPKLKRMSIDQGETELMGFPPGVQRADMGPIGFLCAPLLEELERL